MTSAIATPPLCKAVRARKIAYAGRMRLLPALLALLSLLTPLPAAAQAPDLSRLTGEHRAALHCAAAFAIAASEQARGEAAAMALPPLAVRGKRYFALTGDRVVSEAGVTREQVRDLLSAEVVAMQKRGAGDPDGVVAAEVGQCLARLDAAVPPLKVPDMLQCSAILALAFEELHARDGMSAAAGDMKTLTSVLAARTRENLIAAGKSGDEADAALAGAHDAMLKEAFDDAGGVEKYDIASCYERAKPDPKKHY